MDAHWRLSVTLVLFGESLLSPGPPPVLKLLRLLPSPPTLAALAGARPQRGSPFFDPGGLSFLPKWRPKAPKRIPS